MGIRILGSGNQSKEEQLMKSSNKKTKKSKQQRIRTRTSCTGEVEKKNFFCNSVTESYEIRNMFIN